MNAIEDTIYNHIIEYLKKKAFFSIPELVKYIFGQIKNNLNINKRGIEKYIKSLIDRKIIVIGKKIVKQNILKTQKRSEIFQYITQNPGVNINGIMSALNIGGHIITWHLKFLEKFDCVRAKKIGNQKAYFKFDQDPDFDEFQFYLRHKKAKKIIELVQSNQSPITATEITQILKMNFNTTKKYLDILENLNILKKNVTKNKKYFIFNHDIYNKSLKVLKQVNR